MADPRTKVTLATGVKLYPTQDYELFIDGYGESFVDGQPHVNLNARVAWSNRYYWAVNMLGTHYYDASFATGLRRNTPVAHPSSFFQKAAVDTGTAVGASATGKKVPLIGFYCSAIEYIGDREQLSVQNQTTGELLATKVKPLSWVEGTHYNATTGAVLTAGDGHAEYAVRYEPPLYEIRTDTEMAALDAPLNTCELGRYIIRSYRFGGRQFTLPRASLYWRDKLNVLGGRPPVSAQIPDGYPRVFPEVSINYLWKYVPSIPWDNINACIGKVNSTLAGAGAPSGTFDYQGGWQGTALNIRGFDPGTLLFLGVSEVRPFITAAGQMLYDLNLAFSYRPAGHQKIYRYADDDFYEVVRAKFAEQAQANWKGLLDEADFTQIFRL